MKPATIPVFEPTALEWARLAAYIDGEGHIAIRRTKGKYFMVHVEITNTDPRLMAWCKTYFGGSWGCWDKRSSRKHPLYEWKVQSAQAERILRGCLPYFVIKQEQAHIALLARFLMKSAGYRKHKPVTVDYLHKLEGLKLELQLWHKNPDCKADEVIQ